MSQVSLRVRSTAAARLGVSLAEYDARRAAGEKWCIGCKAWHPVARFQVDRSRGDGRKARCAESCRGLPGKPRGVPQQAARRAVEVATRYGRLAKPNTLPCTDCGHIWAEGERRHEYDHFLGYAPEHRLAVQPVCTLCHADREKVRRNGRQDQD